MENDRENRDVSAEVLKSKAAKFCAYQERSPAAVERKLLSWGASRAQCQQLIDCLTDEGFVNDRRFAREFALGKFRQQHWGRIRIRSELAGHQIPPDRIDEALALIDQALYIRKLDTLIDKKRMSVTENSMDKALQKTAAYCIQKGYEPALVWERLRGGKSE